MPYIQPTPIPEGRAKISGVAQYSIPSIRITSLATKALTASRIYYMPFLVSTPITIDQMAIEVTTAGAGGKIARLAIYNADVDWQPTNKVLDAGTVAVDPGAPPTVTTATVAITLAAGRYLSGLISDGTPTLRSFIGAWPIGLLAALGTSCVPFQMFVAGSGTTLPDPGTAWATISGGGGSVDNMVVYRVSIP